MNMKMILHILCMTVLFPMQVRAEEAPAYAAEIPKQVAAIYINHLPAAGEGFLILPDTGAPGEYLLAIRPLAGAFGYTVSGLRDALFLRGEGGRVISLMVNREYAVVTSPAHTRQTVGLVNGTPQLHENVIYLNAHSLASLLGYVFIATVNGDNELIFHFITRSEATETRYAHNRYIFEGLVSEETPQGIGFIYGQNLNPVRQLRVGALGTGGNHGCGPVAVYNALLYLYLNRPSPQAAAPHPASTIRYLDYRGGMNLGGLAGTNPDILLSYLRRAGYQTEMFTNPVNLDAHIQEAAVSILLYGRVRGGFFIHYVMIRHEGGQFYIYNEFGGDTHARGYDSIDEWMLTRGYRGVALMVI